MNAFFDEKTRELVTLAKGRGLTDCGIQTRWRYDGDRFRLVRYAEEPSCDNWQWAGCPAVIHALNPRCYPLFRIGIQSIEVSFMYRDCYVTVGLLLTR